MAAEEKKTNKKVHDCENETCDGINLNGLFFKCNTCHKIQFLECVIDREEIYELVKAIGMIKYDEKERKFKAYITEDRKKILHKIIGDNTILEFKCLMCNRDGTTIKKIKELRNELEQYKNTNIKLQAKIGEERETIREMMDKNEQLEHTIKENKILIEELTETMERPEKVEEKKMSKENKIKNDAKINNITIETLTVSESEDDMSENESESDASKMKKMKQMMKKTMTKLMQKEIEKMTNTINEKLKNKEEQTKDNHEKEKEYINPFSTKKVTFDNNINKNKTNEYEKTSQVNLQKQNQNNKNIQFSPNLKAIQQSQHKNNNKSYDIYVSKFEYGTAIETIEQHIMNNTNKDIVSKHTFKIEEMISSSDTRRPDYIAFKITTLKKEIYEEIMQIWAPHFNARDFRPSMNIRNKTVNKNEYRENRFEQNRYETPRESYKNRTYDRRYIRENQQFQNTPIKNAKNNRYEMYDTPINNIRNRNTYPTPNNNKYERDRRERERQYAERSERSKRYKQNIQQNDQQTNKQMNFLERHNQAQQVGIYNNGLNTQYRQNKFQ